MKKYLKYIFLLGGFMITSCSEDVIQNYTPGIITEDVAIQNSDDVRILLNTAYSSLYNREEIVFNAVFTDEAGIGIGNGGQGLINEDAYFNYTLNQNSPIASAVWTGNYFTLSRVNRVLKFTDQLVPKNAADADKIAQIKAEALTLRALAHLRILSYFSTDLTNDAALAGILADHTFAVGENENARATNAQFYSLIQNDLTQAISLFSGLVSPTIGTSFATKKFAMGLKARAYSYKGDYPNALIWANQTIAEGVVLAPKAVYPSIFFTDTEPVGTEVLFRLKRTITQSSQDSNLGNGFASVNATASGSAFFEVGRSLFNILQPADVRYSVIIHPTSIIDPNYSTSTNYLASDVLALGKYRGSAAVGNLNSDFKVMRISEMYLIRAEVAAFNNDLSGTATAVKVVRDSRYGAPQIVAVPASKADAYKLLLTERRKEFAFEGYRYLDLKRFGAIAGVGIDRDPKDYQNYPAGNPSFLPITSNKFTLPIPTEELTVNPNIVRNPGY